MPALASMRSNLASLFALGKRNVDPEPPLLTRVVTPGFWPASPNAALPGPPRKTPRRRRGRLPVLNRTAKARPIAIQLKTTLRPIDIDALPDIEAFREFELYTTDHRAEGMVWHRLRLGFFADRESAKSVLGEVKRYFRGARLVGVGKKERLGRNRTALT